jgi:hypothetical protein
MVEETSLLLSNEVVIRISSKRLYSTFYIDTLRSQFELKEPSRLLDLCRPYRHKDFHIYLGKVSVTIVNIMRDRADELTKKLKEFLTETNNLAKVR